MLAGSLTGIPSFPGIDLRVDSLNIPLHAVQLLPVPGKDSRNKLGTAS
jgi:hypothetical protein